MNAHSGEIVELLGLYNTLEMTAGLCTKHFVLVTVSYAVWVCAAANSIGLFYHFTSHLSTQDPFTWSHHASFEDNAVDWMLVPI